MTAPTHRYRWWHATAVALAAFAANTSSGAATKTGGRPPGLPRVPFTPPDVVFLVAWPLLKAGVSRADVGIANLSPSRRRRTLLALRAADWMLFASFSRVGPGSGRPGWILGSTAGQAAATALACALAAPVDRTGTRLLAPQAIWLTYATAVNACGAWMASRRSNGSGRRGGLRSPRPRGSVGARRLPRRTS